MGNREVRISKLAGVAALCGLLAGCGAVQQVPTDNRATRDFSQGGQADQKMVAQMRKRGAMWSQTLERLYQTPEVRKGLARGMAIERLAAIKKNRTYNPYDFSIVGEEQIRDADGSIITVPKVGKVPNMKLLQMAKQGLDDMLYGDGSDKYRDPYTGTWTKYGRVLNATRQLLLGEANRINPFYAAARKDWSGHTAMLNAMEDGAAAFRMPTQVNNRAMNFTDFAERWSQMTPGERAMFKAGAIDQMMRDLDTARAGDKTKKIAALQTPLNMQKLRYMMPDKAEFDSFMGFESGKTLGNSATARRMRRDAAGIYPDLAGAAHHVGQVAGHATGRDDQDVNLKVAKTLTDPNVESRMGPDGERVIGPKRTPTLLGTGTKTTAEVAGDIGAQIAHRHEPHITATHPAGHE